MPKDYELLLLTATIEAGRTCMLRGTVSMCDVNLVDDRLRVVLRRGCTEVAKELQSFS